MKSQELIERAADNIAEEMREVFVERLQEFRKDLVAALVEDLASNGKKPKKRKTTRRKKKKPIRGYSTSRRIVTKKPRKKRAKKGAGKVDKLIKSLTGKRVQTPAELMRACSMETRPALQTAIFLARKQLKPRGLQIVFNKEDGQYELKKA